MTVVLKTTVQANCLSTTDSICHQIRKSSMDRVCVITIVLGSSYQITNIFEREIWTKVHFTQLGFPRIPLRKWWIIVVSGRLLKYSLHMVILKRVKTNTRPIYSMPRPDNCYKCLLQTKLLKKKKFLCNYSNHAWIFVRNSRYIYFFYWWLQRCITLHG